MLRPCNHFLSKEMRLLGIPKMHLALKQLLNILIPEMLAFFDSRNLYNSFDISFICFYGLMNK